LVGAGAFLPEAALWAWRVSSDERSERAVETGEERIGSARALLGLALFAAGAAGIFSDEVDLGSAALRAGAFARVLDVRERAGAALAVPAAVEGDRLELDPIG
jgi:hypothetical protein